MVAEDVLDRARLGRVAERRRRAVRVDVADALRRRRRRAAAPRASSPRRRPSPGPAAPCGARRSTRRSRAPRRRSSRRALARGSSSSSSEHARALAHDEAGARRVERARGVRRVLVLDREPAHRAEAGEDQRVHARLGAAREDGVGVAALDQLRRLADRVRAGRARRDDRVVRAADPERDRDLPARRVDEHVREEERRDAVGPRSRSTSRLLEQPDDAADRRAEDDADARRVEPVEAGVGDRLPRGGDARAGRCARACAPPSAARRRPGRSP